MKAFIRSMLKGLMSIPFLREGLRFLAHKGLLSAAIYKRLPVVGTFQVDISATELFHYISSVGDQTGRILYWEGKGGVDPETLYYFDEIIRKVRSFADIGANVGHFTLYGCAVNPHLHVYAFEPVERTLEHLRRNIRKNGWEDRCTLINAAAGSEEGEIDLHVPYDDFPSSASLEPEGFNNIAGELVKTPLLRLDNYFMDKTPPEVLKIDVEGFEHHVLKGLSTLFAAGYRPIIILECNPGGPDQEITDILVPLNYEFFQLRDDGLAPCPDIQAHPRDPFRNWAAVPKQVT
jgi:FkbM family methyltransferase